MSAVSMFSRFVRSCNPSRILLIVSLCALSSVSFVSAQTISTYAGGEKGPATSSTIDPQGVVIDSAGNLYIADNINHRVRKVTPDGVMSTIAGTGFRGYNGEGVATNARLQYPVGLALDSVGNLYIADSENHRIRKVTPAGVISTFAGTGTPGFSGDGGPATNANLAFPINLAISNAGDVFIVVEGRIRRVLPDGTITTYAGTGVSGTSGDGGPATLAQLNRPYGVALSNSGELYIGDRFAQRVRRVSAGGIISTFAGTGVAGYSGDGGPAINAQFNGLSGLALDVAGNLYVADSANNRIRRISPSGTVITVAGTGTGGFSGDGGLASAANLQSPTAVTVSAGGTVYFADAIRVRTINSAGVINTVAGNDGGGIFYIGDSGPAISANLGRPTGVARDASGNLYVADSLNRRIRKVDASGVITSFAGSTGFDLGDGGPAVSATLAEPTGVAVDSAGNVYIAEFSGHRIRKVNTAGVITTFAGTGIAGFGGDGGPASAAQLNRPWGVTVDAGNNLLISDFGNARIRRISVSGTITTVAGTGTAGFSGDGGLATGANINAAYMATADSAGNIWIADCGNNRVRRVTPAGFIGTVVGTGVASSAGDGGPATSAQVACPVSTRFDSFGNAYISEANGNRVRKVTPGGIISTVAGNGTAGFSGDDGLATSAQLNGPADTAFDTFGNFYVADANNNRIRKITAVAARATNDFSADGKSDIVYADASGAAGVILMSGTVGSASGSILAAGSGWSVTHIADFNGDGKADLLIKNTDGRIAVLLMNGTSISTATQIVGAGSGYTPIVTGDFNGDGKADMVLKNVDGSAVVLLMNGGTATSAGFVLSAGSAWSVTHAGDFNGDGKTDLIVRNNDGSAAVLLMNGTAAGSAGILLGTSSPWSVSHVADLNGDGKTDVIIKNTDGSAAMLLMNGTAVASAAFLLTAGSPYMVTHTGDFNGDGRADILIKHSDGSVVTLLMNGTTVTSAAFLLLAGTTTIVAQVADYNGDGKSDILLRNADGSATVILMNGTAVTAAGNVWGAGTLVAVP